MKGIFFNFIYCPKSLTLSLIMIFFCAGRTQAQSTRDLITEFNNHEFRTLTPAFLLSDFAEIRRTAGKLIYKGGSRSGCLALTERLPFQITTNAAVTGTARLSVKVIEYLSQPGFCTGCREMCEVRPECESPVYSPSAKTYQFRVELIARLLDGSQITKTHGFDNGPSLFLGTQNVSSGELSVPAIFTEKQIDWVQMKICDIQASDNGAKAQLEIAVDNLEVAKFWD